MGKIAGRQRPDYGLDAPGVVRNLAGAGIVAGSLGALADFLFPTNAEAARALRAWGVSVGVSWVVSAAFMIAASRLAKPRLCARFLDRLPWRGDELVLDVGCGHGILLLGAAKRLTSGKAVGVDRWLSRDQADNRASATLRNATLEGVGERIRLVSGDATRLPFADATFDVVVSSWVIHNLKTREARTLALREMARVLKPGGQIALLDIWHTREYVDVLRAAGLVEVRRALATLCFGFPTHRVTARKAITP